VLSGRGLCDELITRPEESYRLWCVVVCDLETSRMRRPWPALGRSAIGRGGGPTTIYSILNADETQQPTEMIRHKERYNCVHSSRGFELPPLSICDVPLLGNYVAYIGNLYRLFGISYRFHL